MSPADNDYYELEQKYKRTLVAEQPGFAVSMLGIFLSILIGIVIRASLAPDKVLTLIDQAAAKIDKRMNAKVGSASISLSDGFFPEVSVVVQDLVISSEENCWMRPHLEVDELKLPISVLHLLKGEIYIHQIIANDVGLTLRTALSECHSRKTASNGSVAPEGPSAATSPENLATDIQDISTAGGQIDEVIVQNFHIHYLPIAFTTVKMRDLNIQVPSVYPKVIRSSGILHLAGETLSGDYSSTAKVSINYSEEKTTKWDLNLSGQWREGHYDLGAEYTPQNQNIQISLDMSHIPLSQLFPLLRKYHILQSDFNGKQIWLTMNAKAKGMASNLQSMPVQVEKLKVEGNFGELESRDIKILSLEPFVYQPIDLDIRSLNLDDLFVFLNRPHPSPTLGKLGTLHGKASFSRTGDVSLLGDLSGLEFIFSNRGIRQTQNLSLISGSILFRHQNWNIKIDRMKPSEGVFLGFLNIEADHDWKNVSLRTRIDDLTFGPSVQKLMTGGGELGSFSADLNANFQNGELKNMSGVLNTSEMIFEQMNIRSSRFHIQTKEKSILLDSKLQGLQISESSPVYQLLAKYLDEQNLQKGIKVSAVTAKMRSHFLNDFSFDQLQMRMTDGYLELRGGWNPSGQLTGLMHVSSSSQNAHYTLSGHRDQPVFQLKK